MKTIAKYVIVILFLCTIPLYFCRMIGWKDDAGKCLLKYQRMADWNSGSNACGISSGYAVKWKKDICSGNCIIHRDKRRSCVVNATTQLGMEKQG